MILKVMAGDYSSRREAVAAVRKRRSRHRRTSKTADAYVKNVPRPTTLPPLPPKHGGTQAESDNKVMVENDRAWSALLKPQQKPELHPKSQPKLQSEPEPLPIL